VVAAIILWNTVYLERAIRCLKEHGLSSDENLLQHLSPLGWEHINLTGDYVWRRQVGQCDLREHQTMSDRLVAATESFASWRPWPTKPWRSPLCVSFSVHLASWRAPHKTARCNRSSEETRSFRAGNTASWLPAFRSLSRLRATLANAEKRPVYSCPTQRRAYRRVGDQTATVRAVRVGSDQPTLETIIGSPQLRKHPG
jgi:hypothetical protein